MTPTRARTYDAKENLKIRLIKLQKMIDRLREYAKKYKVIFHFVKEVNHQVRDSNLNLYARNDALKRKNK